MNRTATTVILSALAGLMIFSLLAGNFFPGEQLHTKKPGPVYWVAPDTSLIPHNAQGDLIRYGRDLIVNTSHYLGPKGTVAAISNGMNCQNCHLDAGTKFWGNNYGAVYSTYPQYRARSGGIETIYKRINDCLERSLNGKALDSNSREMRAMYAYFKWLGRNIPPKVKPVGTGINNLPFLTREADPQKGHQLFLAKCSICHGTNGQGLLNDSGTSYTYPPLWGEHSYNSGAGLYRISRFAGYIKDNMPFGASHGSQRLSIEEAWDIAAFVNSQERAKVDFKEDWPDISKKPFDHPFGPYADSFGERRHKYGPFASIAKDGKKK